MSRDHPIVIIGDDEGDIEIVKAGAKLKTKPALFLKLSGYEEHGARLISSDEFVGEYSKLAMGNGCDFARDGSPFTRKYKCATRKINGTVRCLWNADEEEKSLAEKDFAHLLKGGGNKITHFKIYGRRDADRVSRAIPQHVREHFKDARCVSCGNGSIEIDHKNGLYNFPKGYIFQIEDFQPLCMHCNQQKRQSIVRTKETGKRYKATTIPMVEVLRVDFTQGDESYDPSDPNAMVGTYWYDPVDFTRKAIEQKLGKFVSLLVARSGISCEEIMQIWKLSQE